jgi:hypothetical protein
MFDDPPPLTDAQVQAGARPGESWDEARERLWYEAQAKPEIEGERLADEYYEVCEQIFQRVHGPHPVDERALIVLRARRDTVQLLLVEHGQAWLLRPGT